MRWVREQGGMVLMPDSERTTPTRAPEPQAEERKSEYVVCQEVTIGELLTIVKADVDAGAMIERKALIAIEDGQQPSGTLVRARIQRQTVRDGRLVWTPER